MALFSKRQKEKPVGVAKPALAERAPAPAPKLNGTAPPLTEQQKQASLAHAHQVHASLGGLVSVMMRSPRYQAVPLGYVQALLSPAIGTGQFAIANAHDKERGLAAPVALVLWASVSPEVDARLSALGDKPMVLPMQDWRSGDIPWLMALVGDQRVAQPLLTNLQDKTFKGRALKARIKENGAVVVRTVSPATLLPENLAL
jgi:hemolysin-activating ACP:hemolysin acyltransferase